MSQDNVLPLVEEAATVSKRSVPTGKVRISTHVDVAHEMARAVLQSETVEVTRVEIGSQIDTVPEVRTEGDLTIIPVCEEVLVVEKKLFLKEELHVRRRTETETVETPIALRRQRAVVERFDEARRPISDAEQKP